MTDEEILRYIFKPACFDCKTEAEDLQIAITLNPDLNKILKSMQLARADSEAKLQKAIEAIDNIQAHLGNDMDSLDRETIDQLITETLTQLKTK